MLFLFILVVALASGGLVLLHVLRISARRLVRIGARPTLQNLFIVDELEELYWLERMEGADGWAPWDPYAGRELEPAQLEVGESSWESAPQTVAS